VETTTHDLATRPVTVRGARLDDGALIAAIQRAGSAGETVAAP
jgi:hypothetical protein